MKMMKQYVLLFLVVGLASFSACYYDNLAELHPNVAKSTCDSAKATISYASDIAPIINASCGPTLTGCHSASTSFPLSDYTGVHDIAAANCLYESITPPYTSSCGSSQMPKDAPKLDDCKIAMIKKWINQGMLNN